MPISILEERKIFLRFVCVCVWIIFKVFIEFVTTVYLFYVLHLGHKAHEILAP